MDRHSIPEKPWYRQFWPWFLIMLPLSAVIAGIATLLIALRNPDYLVVEPEEYEQIRNEFRAIKPTED